MGPQEGDLARMRSRDRESYALRLHLSGSRPRPPTRPSALRRAPDAPSTVDTRARIQYWHRATCKRSFGGPVLVACPMAHLFRRDTAPDAALGQSRLALSPFVLAGREHLSRAFPICSPAEKRAPKPLAEVLKDAGKKALGGGIPGAAAMGVQVRGELLPIGPANRGRTWPPCGPAFPVSRRRPPGTERRLARRNAIFSS